MDHGIADFEVGVGNISREEYLLLQRGGRPFSYWYRVRISAYQNPIDQTKSMGEQMPMAVLVLWEGEINFNLNFLQWRKQMSLIGKKIRFCVFLVCLGFMITGCATSRGAYQMTTPVDEQKLARYSDLTIVMTCSPGVPVAQHDLERMKTLIVKNVPSQCPDRFRTIDSPNPGANTLKASVNLTKYDGGNAFARAMLAGLGQMHIDATVTLSDYMTGENVARSDVNKTFAWGGMYGGFTQIKDIEDGFAQAVAASFAGKK